MIRNISPSEFERIWTLQGATSIPEFPVSGDIVSFRSSIAEFNHARLFPARYVDRAKSKFLRSFDGGAVPISFWDLIKENQLRDDMLQERTMLQRGRQRLRPHVIVENCQGCNSYIVKDGCKELLSEIYNGSNNQLDVVMIRGFDWAYSEYDMKLVCICSYDN